MPVPDDPSVETVTAKPSILKSLGYVALKYLVWGILCFIVIGGGMCSARR